MTSKNRWKKVGELGLVVVLLVASLALGRVAGAALFTRQPETFVSPDTTPPTFIMARNAEGKIAPLELASRTRPLIAIVLSVDCPYCRASLPYWRELNAALDDIAGGPEILVVSVSSAERTARYLDDNDLPVPAVFVDNDELDVLGLPGVPGTIEFGVEGAPMRRVIGVLDADKAASLVAWAKAVASPS